MQINFCLENLSKTAKELHYVKHFVKNRGRDARDFIGNFGSQLVSGDNNKDGESVVMETALYVACARTKFGKIKNKQQTKHDENTLGDMRWFACSKMRKYGMF